MVLRSVASALTILTSEQFTPSDISDNNTLEAFVLEYFTGSGEITEDEDSEGKQEVQINFKNITI